MTRYQVLATADLLFEIDAESSQEAADRIADAFKLTAPYDPLANVKFVIADGSKFAAIDVELKTTTIQEWSALEIETREAD